MKPVFANTFNVASSNSHTDMTLNFYHVYPEHKFIVKGSQLTDVSAQVCDDVASIMLTKEGAISVAKLLNKVISEWGIEL